MVRKERENGRCSGQMLEEKKDEGVVEDRG